MNNKKEEWLKYLTAALLSAVVLLLSALFLVRSKQEFSETENRYLASAPVFSWERIKSGVFMEEMSDYLSDQFPFRTAFLNLQTQAELLLGRKEINGVFIAEDNYLIEAYETPVNTEKICGILNGFAEKIKALEQEGRSVNVNLMLVPTASSLLSEKLPAYAPAVSQLDTIQEYKEKLNFSVFDCASELEKLKETHQIYYRTDHHWTTAGAYAGYRAYCLNSGLTPLLLEEWTKQTVTGAFYGTIDAKVNAYHQKGDAIVLYTHPEDRIRVTDEETGEAWESLYQLSYLEQRDKYSLFLDNLHSLLRIENEAAQTKRVLMLLKDSYANSMVPFLTRHFQTIYVFDTRSYKKGASVFLKEHPEVTDVLLLYNMNTIDTDLGIRGIY